MGSTSNGLRLPRTAWDHPHIHGEHPTIPVMQQMAKGSPPYTWGALVHFGVDTREHGITPIYMGSTGIGKCSASWYRDHPHIHGEHNVFWYSRVPTLGSPPYTWGALNLFGLEAAFSGITPIYMGSTLKDPCNQAIFKSSKTLFQSVWS